MHEGVCRGVLIIAEGAESIIINIKSVWICVELLSYVSLIIGISSVYTKACVRP